MSEVDHDAETQCGATELGVAIEATGPQLAYSEELPILDYPEPASRARVALITGGIVLVAGLVVGGVLFFGRARHEAPTPVAATATTTTTVSPVAAPPPAPPPPVTITTVIVQSTVAQKTPTPQAARTLSTWTYDVKWGGAPGISVIEHGYGTTHQSYVVNGASLGSGTGWTGDLIGVDPILEEPLTWASCTLYVDGRVAKTSFATRGDGNDVSCLVRLTR